MTLAEAKDTKRWWLQNSYKHKGEPTPENVVEAIRILDGRSTTASATIKVLNSAPQLNQPVGFAGVAAEPVQAGGLAEWVADVKANAPTILKNGRQVVQDKFTPELEALALERKTASPERLDEITREQMRIYNKRLALKKKGITNQATPFKSVVKPKKPVKPVLDTPAKPSSLPNIIQSEPVEIPPAPAPVSDQVNHPAHYTDGKIEVIDFIEDKQLCFHLGNAVKYISRAGKKDPSKTLEDLKKAQWYLARKIQQLEQPGK